MLSRRQQKKVNQEEKPYQPQSTAASPEKMPRSDEAAAAYSKEVEKLGGREAILAFANDSRAAQEEVKVLQGHILAKTHEHHQYSSLARTHEHHQYSRKRQEIQGPRRHV